MPSISIFMFYNIENFFSQELNLLIFKTFVRVLCFLPYFFCYKYLQIQNQHCWFKNKKYSLNLWILYLLYHSFASIIKFLTTKLKIKTVLIIFVKQNKMIAHIGRYLSLFVFFFYKLHTISTKTIKYTESLQNLILQTKFTVFLIPFFVVAPFRHLTSKLVKNIL